MKLEEGEELKGFMLSCEQNREKQAVKDAFNFLNEFIDKLYPNLEPTGPHKKHNTGQHESLESELLQLKRKENRVLFSLDTGVKCLIFVKINPSFPDVDPVKVVEAIMEEMKEGRQVTRYCHKVLPVQRAFRAEFFHMKDVVQELMGAMTKAGEKRSWALHFKCRNNDKFKYKEVVKEVTQIAQQLGHFTEIYYPEMTVCIEVSHHLMCVSILETFKKFNEYKLRKINCLPLDRVKQVEVEEKRREGEVKEEREREGEGEKEVACEPEQFNRVQIKRKLVEEVIQIGDGDVQFV